MAINKIQQIGAVVCQHRIKLFRKDYSNVAQPKMDNCGKVGQLLHSDHFALSVRPVHNANYFEINIKNWLLYSITFSTYLPLVNSVTSDNCVKESIL